jgi:glutathione-specific gamma-glutamylcyclotransferase
MWVFGYGSLMWDGWERAFSGACFPRAVLYNYRRAFNKGSWRNWGTRQAPGPTLGLELEDGATCVGTAFEIADARRAEVLDYLRKREGRSFALQNLEVRLADGRTVDPLVPINERNSRTYLGGLHANELAKLAKVARGTSGTCAEYVANTSRMLLSHGIQDPHVEAFLAHMRHTE